MKFNWILALLKFCTLYAVDNGDASATNEPTDVTTDVTTDAEPVNVGDEAWEAIENPVDEPKPDVNEPAAEVKTEEKDPAKPEVAKAEEKPAEITEDDLKPLESKNAATNERFQKITEGFKAEKARADLASQEVDRYKNSFASLKQLGFSDATAAEDLVEFSAYRHVLATGDAEQFKGIIESQIKQFQAMHGKSIAITGNIVDDYQDLKTKVDGLELDEQDAIEIARARKVQERANRDTQNQNSQRETAQQSQNVLDSAVASVTALQTNWKNTDPDYNAIMPHLQPLIAEIGKTYAPHLWAATLEMQYKVLKKTLVANAGNENKDLPLRGNGHMTGKPAPTSTEEAVLQAMGME